MKLFNFKKLVEKRSFRPIPRSRKSFVPKGLNRSYQVDIQTIRAKEVATFELKEQTNGTHLIFLHGGAYIFEAAPLHWSFAKKIVDKNRCRMTIIDYPLAPEHSYRETYEMISQAYEMLLQAYPEDEFLFMGDSAGAGLALGFCQQLLEADHPQPPKKLILLSPWLDLTMTNPEVERLRASDHILTVEMLRNAGSMYAGGDDQDQYRLSPIHGELKKLPPTLIFYGTEELFYADCRKLQAMVAGVNEQVEFKEYEGMQHDWEIFPIPERERVVEEICEFIQD